MNKNALWLIIAIFAGFALAVYSFRRAYRPRPVTAIPVSARPRWLQFGDYWDPYSIWPYGPNSIYQFWTNSGVPTTETVSLGSRSVITAPLNSLYAGNGGGPGVGPGVNPGGGRGRG